MIDQIDQQDGDEREKPYLSYDDETSWPFWIKYILLQIEFYIHGYETFYANLFEIIFKYIYSMCLIKLYISLKYSCLVNNNKLAMTTSFSSYIGKLIWSRETNRSIMNTVPPSDLVCQSMDVKRMKVLGLKCMSVDRSSCRLCCFDCALK